MEPAIKWIATATGAVVLFFASAAMTGAYLESRGGTGTSGVSESGTGGGLAEALQIPAETDDRATTADPAPESDASPSATLLAAAEKQAGPAAAPARPAAAPQAFMIKRILPIDGPIKYGEWHWDDADVPDGPLVVTVDLDARVLSVFRGGYEIGAAAVMLGTDEHPTPLGTFPILSKERHNVSEKYGNAPMPWTLRLTWDGVAIHGGAEVERGYASHGCIGTPNDFVSKLYAIARKGDKVIITRGKSAGVGDRLI